MTWSAIDHLAAAANQAGCMARQAEQAGAWDAAARLVEARVAAAAAMAATGASTKWKPINAKGGSNGARALREARMARLAEDTAAAAVVEGDWRDSTVGTREAAARLGKAWSTVTYLCAEGRIPSVRVQRGTRTVHRIPTAWLNEAVA